MSRTIPEALSSIVRASGSAMDLAEREARAAAIRGDSLEAVSYLYALAWEIRCLYVAACGAVEDVQAGEAPDSSWELYRLAHEVAVRDIADGDLPARLHNLMMRYVDDGDDASCDRRSVFLHSGDWTH